MENSHGDSKQHPVEHWHYYDLLPPIIKMALAHYSEDADTKNVYVNYKAYGTHYVLWAIYETNNGRIEDLPPIYQQEIKRCLRKP